MAPLFLIIKIMTTTILCVFIIFLVFNKIECIMDVAQYEDNKDMRKLVRHKLWFGIGQLIVMSITIIFCAYMKYVDTNTMGALLAGIYAYSLKGVFDKK